MKNRGFALYMALGLGYAFLYLPIVLLVVYSFNASRLVTVWGGFSTKWYAELLTDQKILDAAWLSLKVAVLNATISTVLGTLAAVVLVRFRRFTGRTLFTGMITAPLVMPEIITGLAMLLLFVSMEQAIGWPDGRSMTTIVIAHVTFSLSFVTVVVQSRLAQMDISLEEAAMDLGARPAKVFLVITLPIIAPALLAGWLLSFTLSIDDVVISSFVTGPGSTTLPIVIFSKVRLGVSPEINALASIVVAIVSIGIVIFGMIVQRQETERLRAMKTASDRE
ncbi:MAG TPA: ABC transporter permease subunit [Telmatospirillum sp.]|nr:ABC transporter permease subunit [Telmatospirillum sp.]